MISKMTNYVKYKIRMRPYEEQAAAGKRWCYDCEHFFRDYFCGYAACHCNLHGSLDIDQNKRHPDKTADTCIDYKSSGMAPWWEKLFEEL